MLLRAKNDLTALEKDPKQPEKAQVAAMERVNELQGQLTQTIEDIEQEMRLRRQEANATEDRIQAAEERFGEMNPEERRLKIELEQETVVETTFQTDVDEVARQVLNEARTYIERTLAVALAEEAAKHSCNWIPSANPTRTDERRPD